MESCVKLPSNPALPADHPVCYIYLQVPSKNFTFVQIDLEKGQKNLISSRCFTTSEF